MTAGVSKSPSELRVEKSASHRRKFLGRGLPFQLRTNRLARTLFGLVQPGACAVLILVFAWHGFSPFPCARHISAEFISYRANMYISYQASLHTPTLDRSRTRSLLVAFWSLRRLPPSQASPGLFWRRLARLVAQKPFSHRRAPIQ